MIFFRLLSIASASNFAIYILEKTGKLNPTLVLFPAMVYFFTYYPVKYFIEEQEVIGWKKYLVYLYVFIIIVFINYISLKG